MIPRPTNTKKMRRCTVFLFIYQRDFGLRTVRYCIINIMIVVKKKFVSKLTNILLLERKKAPVSQIITIKQFISTKEEE